MSSNSAIIIVGPTASSVASSTTLPPNESPITTTLPPVTSSGSTITRIIVPITSFESSSSSSFTSSSSSSFTPTTTTSSSTSSSTSTSRSSSTSSSATRSTTTVSSILISSVTVGSSTKSLSTTSSTSSPTSNAESSSGSSPVLVTTISVVVGALLLALLAAWIIHTLIKSRREKKESERLAVDEDLDGMFQSRIMVNNVANNRNSLYEQNDAFWDQKNDNHRASIISLDNGEYPLQVPEVDGQVISTPQDSEDPRIPETRLQSQGNFTEEIEGTGAIVGADLIRQATVTSNSTAPLIQNVPTGGNFVRVISDYVAVRPDELNMRQGQILMLEQSFQDGWAYGKNITTEERGMFPFNFVAPVDSSIFQRSLT